MKYLALAIALMLGGCGTTYKISVDADQAKVDRALTETCDLVPNPPPRSSSFGTVYEFSNKLVGLYGECAVRDRAKYDYIKSQGH